MAFSGGTLRPASAGMGADGGIPRASLNALKGAMRPVDVRGEALSGAGDADSEGALKGWKSLIVNDVRRGCAASSGRREERELCVDRGGMGRVGGEGDSGPSSLAFRSADKGLVPAAGPTWWKVDMLPYA